MTWLAQLLIDVRTRVAALFWRGALRDRVDEELQFHLDMRIERLVDAGLTPAQARARARNDFGNLLVLREAAVDMWRYRSMEQLIQDVRYALRMLLRAPGFTAVAVISLALGIGANAAIFSLIDRVMLRLLPVEDPSRLVLVDGVRSHPRFDYLRVHTDRAFAGLWASPRSRVLAWMAARIAAASPRAASSLVRISACWACGPCSAA